MRVFKKSRGFRSKSKIGGFVDVEIKIEGNGKSALNGNHPD